MTTRAIGLCLALAASLCHGGPGNDDGGDDPIATPWFPTATAEATETIDDTPTTTPGDEEGCEMNTDPCGRELISVPPELMTAAERTVYVNTAFDRASQGKLITMQTGQATTLNPGSYYMQTAGVAISYTDPTSLQIWTVSPLSQFNIKSPRILTALGAPIQLVFYPDHSDHGIPLRTQVLEGGGLITFAISFGGSGCGIETGPGPGFVFTRNLYLNGPITATWAAAAGSVLQISYNAFL